MEADSNHHLELKSAGWRISKRLSQELQDVYGVKSIRRLLHTSDSAVARKRRDAVLAALERRDPFEQLFRAWKAGHEGSLSELSDTAALLAAAGELDSEAGKNLEEDCLRALDSLDVMDTIIERLSHRLSSLEGCLDYVSETSN